MRTPARTAVEVERARAIIQRHGWNSTVYQVLNPGIRLWFSEHHDALVGFVDQAGVRVVAGAPVAAADALPAVVDAFERATREARLRTCYFAAEPRLQAVCRARGGYSTVSLGAQPSWDPRDWGERLASHASLRHQLYRARNKGLSVRELHAIDGTMRAALRRCLTEWLGTRGLPPLHFMVEPETLGQLEGRRVFVAEQEDTVVGFLVASPIPTRHGWLVEQVVRGKDAPNGTSENLIDAANRATEAAGSTYITLGLAPLARREGVPPNLNPWWLRLILTWARAHGDRFYNFRGLETFKDKFRPDNWEPVYAIAAEERFLPSTLYAIAAAFAQAGPFGPIATIARGIGMAVGQEARTLLG